MDLKKYHESWNDTIRPAILKRDNYKCRDCSVRHRAKGQWVGKKQFVEFDDWMLQWAQVHGQKIIRIILQVHHKDGNKENNEYSNLETLCSRCHFEAEKVLNIIKRKIKTTI